MEEQQVHEEHQVRDTKDERTWAMVCHLVTFAGFIFPIGGNILAPLIIWMIKRDEYPLVDDQGKEVVNFQLSLFIYLVISGILAIILIGIPLLIALGIFDIIVTIVAAVKANEGVKYRYPLNLRLIK